MSYSRRAAIYEVEYQEERDVPFVLSLLEQSKTRVLEMPCGAGRLSQHLVSKAKTLDIVDLEPDMVERAVGATNSISSQCSVVGHVQDMRTLSLDRRVDLVILPREGLQLVSPDDGKKVLSAAAAHLVPEGLIFVDLACFSKDNDPCDPDYYKHGQSTDIRTLDWTRQMDDGTLLSRSTTQSDEGDAIIFTMNYVQHSNPKVEWSSQMQIYRYDSEWVKSSAPEGINLESIYGGYDCSSLQADSVRMLALFRKLPANSQTRGDTV